MSEELKPCPFCGCNPNISYGCYGYTGDDYVRISCCIAASDGRYNSWNARGKNPTRSEAYVEALVTWNCRVEEPSNEPQ